MLDLTKTEILKLLQLLAQHTPLAEHSEVFDKLTAELSAKEAAEVAAEQVTEYEAEHAAKLAKLNAEYPVAVGDTAEVTIGKRTYRAVVQYRSEAPAGTNYAANARQLGLLVLRKDGQPNKAMNGTKGQWTGLVAKSDVRKTA